MLFFKFCTIFSNFISNLIYFRLQKLKNCNLPFCLKGSILPLEREIIHIFSLNTYGFHTLSFHSLSNKKSGKIVDRLSPLFKKTSLLSKTKIKFWHSFKSYHGISQLFFGYNSLSTLNLLELAATRGF